jgi:hypothetical protein
MKVYELRYNHPAHSNKPPRIIAYFTAHNNNPPPKDYIDRLERLGYELVSHCPQFIATAANWGDYVGECIFQDDPYLNNNPLSVLSADPHTCNISADTGADLTGVVLQYEEEPYLVAHSHTED